MSKSSIFPVLFTLLSTGACHAQLQTKVSKPLVLLNQLAKQFGIQFNQNSKGRVIKNSPGPGRLDQKLPITIAQIIPEEAC